MKYQTRSIIVEAVQWRGDNQSQLARLATGRGSRCSIKFGKPKKKRLSKTKSVEVPGPISVYMDKKKIGNCDVGEYLVKRPDGMLAVLSEREFKDTFVRIGANL